MFADALVCDEQLRCSSLRWMFADAYVCDEQLRCSLPLGVFC